MSPMSVRKGCSTPRRPDHHFYVATTLIDSQILSYHDGKIKIFAVTTSEQNSQKRMQPQACLHNKKLVSIKKYRLRNTYADMLNREPVFKHLSQITASMRTSTRIIENIKTAPDMTKISKKQSQKHSTERLKSIRRVHCL